MSDYFTRKNKIEFGPGPTKEIEWIVLQNPKLIEGTTQCAIVKAKTAYLAWEKAASIIDNFDKQCCQCFPNPKILFEKINK